jgi:hypothetical protein
MTVEARADERAVFVPRVARVGGGVDREHRERTGAYTGDDRGLLLRAPRRFADGEERERAGVAERGRVDRAHVVDPLSGQTVQFGDLGDADGGLVEHPVHARRPITVRRDLGDEQQLIDHWCTVTRQDGGRRCQPMVTPRRRGGVKRLPTRST